MDYETISKMKVPELKNFLRLRGLKITGIKPELISRVLYAVENNIPILKTAEEIESQIKMEYEQKLHVENITIPDPFGISNGWKNEDEGICHWPLISSFNIITFLMIDKQVEDLNDYKSSKAYSYFEQGWLGELLYLSLDDTPYCLIKTDCTPSQRLSNTKHKLWLLLVKENGKVLRAHCSCMAGANISYF